MGESILSDDGYIGGIGKYLFWSTRPSLFNSERYRDKEGYGGKLRSKFT